MQCIVLRTFTVMALEYFLCTNLWSRKGGKLFAHPAPGH